MILHIYTIIHTLISLIRSEDSRQLRRRRDQHLLSELKPEIVSLD
jgi:hypothetical protein